MIGQSSSVIKSCLFNWENLKNFSPLFVWQNSKIQHFKFTIFYKKKITSFKKVHLDSNSPYAPLAHQILGFLKFGHLKKWPKFKNLLLHPTKQEILKHLERAHVLVRNSWRLEFLAENFINSKCCLIYISLQNSQMPIAQISQKLKLKKHKLRN